MTSHWPSREGGWNLLDVVPDGIIAVDVPGRIVHTNVEAERLLGYEAGELLGQPIEVLIPDQARARHGAHVRAFFTSPRVRLMGSGLTLHALRKDGVCVAVDIAISPVETERGPIVVASLRDIRERLEVRESRDMLQALLDNVPDVIFQLDAEGAVRFINRRTAWTPPDVIGMPWLDFLDGEHRERARAAFGAVMRSGEPTSLEVAVAWLDERRWYTVNMGPIGWDGTKARGVVLVSHDITARKAAETQLLTSDRMAAVGILAAGVAHEINNPLAAVVANVELAHRAIRNLAQSYAVPQELDDELRDAREAADRVRSIVRDLNVLSRGDDEARVAVEVPKVLDSTLRIAWNEVRHRARLVRQYERVPLVHASESRLGQVFLNLLLNAAQAIPEGHADTNEITVATRTDKSGCAVIEVTDTGAGIAPDVLPRLFTPFFTTKAAGVGTGLGLAICHRIVVGLGGDIAVESVVGRGTTFRVTMPAAPGVRRTTAPPISPRSSTAPRRGNVLVVDDDALVLSTVRRILDEEHDVTVTRHAAEAARWLRQGRRFDVIVCDLMMPLVSGMDLYDEVAALDTSLCARFVFATGGAFTPRAQAFLERVPNTRLDKPFDLDELRALVNGLVR